MKKTLFSHLTQAKATVISNHPTHAITMVNLRYTDDASLANIVLHINNRTEAVLEDNAVAVFEKTLVAMGDNAQDIIANLRPEDKTSEHSYLLARSQDKTQPNIFLVESYDKNNAMIGLRLRAEAQNGTSTLMNVAPDFAETAHSVVGLIKTMRTRTRFGAALIANKDLS